jgi:hypothetical protein
MRLVLDQPVPRVLTHEGWTHPAPNVLVLVAPDGTQQTLAVVDRSRFERLRALAEAMVEWKELQDAPRNDQWNLDLSRNFRKKISSIAALEPGDLDPIP